MAQPPYNGGMQSSQYPSGPPRQNWSRNRMGPHQRPPVLPVPPSQPQGPPGPGGSGALISPTGSSYGGFMAAAAPQHVMYATPGGPQLIYQQRPVHHGYPPQQQQQYMPHPQSGPPSYYRPQQQSFYPGQPTFVPQQQVPPPQQMYMVPQSMLQTHPQSMPPLLQQPLPPPPQRRPRTSAVTIKDPDTKEDVTMEILSGRPATPRSETPSSSATTTAEETTKAVVMKDPTTNESISAELLAMSPEERKKEVVENVKEREEPEAEPPPPPPPQPSPPLVVVEKEEVKDDEELPQDGVASAAVTVAVETTPPPEVEREDNNADDVESAAPVPVDVDFALIQSATDDEKMLERNVPDEMKEGLDSLDAAMATENEAPEEEEEGEEAVEQIEEEEQEERDQEEEEETPLELMTDSAKVAGISTSPDQEEEEEEEEDVDEESESEGNKENEAEKETMEAENKAQDARKISYTTPEQWNPNNKAGQKKYDRSFLLQFQQYCVDKPKGLADVECVLDKMISEQIASRQAASGGYRSSGAGGSGRSRGGGGGSGSADSLAPSWLRSDPSKQFRSKGPRPSKQPKVIEMKTIEKLERSENAWVRMSERSQAEEDAEKLVNKEVLRKARGILNKLTPEKFQPLCKQMMDLEITTELRLTGVMDVVFEKAITEPGFSVAYAWLCFHLAKIKVPLADGSAGNVSFRKLLLTRCQKEFEKDKESLTLDQIREVVEAIENEEERASKKTELLEQEFRVRRRSLGNVRFIGELYKLQLLTEPIMHDCVIKLLESSDQESLECMCRLMTTVGQRLDVERAKLRIDQYFERIKKLIDKKKIPSRVRFMLQDLVELRENNWVPRREDNNPKTLTQIRKEVARDEQQQKMQLLQHAKKEKESGSKAAERKRGGGSSKGGLPQADQSWQVSTSGLKSSRTQTQGHAFDAEKFATIKDKPRGGEAPVRLGPSGGKSLWGQGSRASGGSSPNMSDQRKGTSGASAGGRGRGREASSPGAPPGGRKSSTGGLTMKEKAREERQALLAQMPSLMQDPKKVQVATAKAEERGSPTSGSKSPSDSFSRPDSPVVASTKEVSDEEVEKKTKSLVEEYCSVEDMKEAIQCVKELNAPSKYWLLSRVAVETTLEQNDKNRCLTAKLLRKLIEESLLTVEDYFKGMNEILEFGDDMAIDIPRFWDYMGSSIGTVAAGLISKEKLEDGLKLPATSNPASRQKLFGTIADTVGTHG